MSVSCLEGLEVKMVLGLSEATLSACLNIFELLK